MANLSTEAEQLAGVINVRLKAIYAMLNGTQNNLNALNTDAKTNLVAAVNELKGLIDAVEVGGGVTTVAELTDRNTYDFTANTSISVALAAKAPLVSPSFTTPALGTPTSGNLANCTFPTLNQSTTGNAATATALQTGRTINGITFDGTSNIEVPVADADYLDIKASNEGMAFDKPSMTIVDGTTKAILNVEKLGGGDIDYYLGGQRYTLDCTTSGPAEVDLIHGASATTPAKNYIYVTESLGELVLNVSSTLPTGEFGWVGKVVVPDYTTWQTTGAYLIQRFTESFLNNSRGTSSHEREKLRALGAVYISGGTSTLDINTATTPDTVHLQVASAEVYQLHRQSFPQFLTGPYLVGNGTTPYASITSLDQVTATVDGTAISDNDRYNLVVWGAVNLDSGNCKIFVNAPTGVYRNDSQAAADINGTADYSVPEAMRSVAFMIARVCLRYDSSAGGETSAIGDGVYSLLGTPVGVRAGGSGAALSTEFVDSTFRLFDNSDSTKQVAFEASGITTATTRTITIPDNNLTMGAAGQVETYLVDDGIHSLTSSAGVCTPDASNGHSQNFTLTENVTDFNVPTNLADGESMSIGGTQDAVTPRTLTLDAAWKIYAGAAADIGSLAAGEGFELAIKRVGSQYRIWISTETA